MSDDTTKPAKAAKAKTATIPTGRRYSLGAPADVMEVANHLADFIKANSLTTNVQGKEFVNVEGWQYAGSFFGLYARTENVLNVSTEGELKYQAKVVVHNPESGHEVGCGIMCCSNKESGKKFYQEYAIMSMAQTRAAGKAYRLCLSFLMRLAGFEPTPAEEMDYDAAPKATAPAPQPVAALAPAIRTEESADQAPPVQYATASQKEEIIRLLNHPVVTRPEKTKCLLNINRLDEARATDMIAKLKKAIDERESAPTVIA